MSGGFLIGSMSSHRPLDIGMHWVLWRYKKIEVFDTSLIELLGKSRVL